MDIEKPYFGMSDKEIEGLRQNALSWTDSNHPVTENDDGEKKEFHEVIIEGAKRLLMENDKIEL